MKTLIYIIARINGKSRILSNEFEYWTDPTDDSFSMPYGEPYELVYHIVAEHKGEDTIGFIIDVFELYKALENVCEY